MTLLNQKNSKKQHAMISPFQRPTWGASGSVLGASWAVLKRFGGSTWPQLDPQNGHQNDQNSKHFFNPFLNASEDRNFWDFGGFLKPKRTQVDPMLAPKIEVNFERRFFEKTLFFKTKKTMILKVLGVEVGSKDRSKIDQKMKS